MMLSLQQVAEQCGVAEYTVRQWIKAGELRAVNYSVRSTSRKPILKVRQVDLDAFNEARSTSPAPMRELPKRKISKVNRIQFYEEG